MNPSGCSVSPQPPSGSSPPTSKARLASRYSVALNAPVEGSGLRPHQTNHGTLSSWPSPTTAAASQPALLKRLGELLRRHGEWVSALQKDGPNDIHQPHHSVIIERHRIAIDHLCSALGGSFAQYAPIFEGISDLSKQMLSVYDLLASSALAVQDNNAAVDLQHAGEVAALQNKIEHQHEEINKLSDTAALLDRLEAASLEERNLRQKLSDAEQKVHKLTASISEQHEQYTSLHQRCVRANATEDRLKGVVADLEERLNKSTVLAEALTLEQEYLREKVDGQMEELGDVRHQNGRLLKQLADFEEKLAASQEELSRAERRAQMRGRRESLPGMGMSSMARSRIVDGTQREDTTLPSPRRAAGRPPTPRPNWMDLPSALKRHSTIINESNRLQYVQSPIDFLASCGAVNTLRVIKMSATGHSTPVVTLTPEEEAVKSSEGKVGVLCKALAVSHQFVSDLLRTVDALVRYAESMRGLYGELGVEPLETYRGMIDRQFESLKLELQATSVHAAVPTAAPVARMPLPRPSIGNVADMDRSTNSSSGDKTAKKLPLKGAPGRSLPVPPPPPPTPFLCGHMLFHPRRGSSFGTIVVPSRLPPPPDVAKAQTDRRYVRELSEGQWAPNPSDDVMLAVQKHLLRHTIDPTAVEAGGDGMYGFAVPMVLEASTKKSTHKPHSKEHLGDPKAFSQVTEHPALFFPLTLLVDLYEGIYDYIAAQHLLAGPDAPKKLVDEATLPQRLSEPDGEPPSSTFVEDFVCAVRHVLLPKLIGLEGLCSAQDKYLTSVDNLVALKAHDAAKLDLSAKSTKSKKDTTADAQWAHLGHLQTPPASIGTSRGAGVAKAVTLDSVVYSLLFHTYRIHHRLPAARLFLLHLHGCIAKTSFTLLRRCLGSVRRRMHDVAPTNFVVAVPPPEGGNYPKEAIKDGVLPTLSDVVSAVGEEVPFLAPVWLPLIHESLLGDASTFALLVEGSHPFHYLLPSSSEYSHRSEVMRLPTDTSVPASHLLTGDPSVSDIGFQVAAGCVRTVQGQHFDLVRLMMDGAVRIQKEGESSKELLSLRTAPHTPCGPFVQMLTHAFLTQQLWGVYSLQGALREVYTMSGGTLGAGLSSLLNPSDAFPEDATVSYMSVQQAFEKADPSARPDALRKLLADSAHLSPSDLAPRLKFSARGLAQRLLSVPYLRCTPLPPVASKSEESVSAEVVGVFAGASSTVALPTATTLPGLLKSFRAKQAGIDIGRDALRRRGMRDAADEALIRFTSEPVHTM